MLVSRESGSRMVKVILEFFEFSVVEKFVCLKLCQNS